MNIGLRDQLTAAREAYNVALSEEQSAKTRTVLSLRAVDSVLSELMNALKEVCRVAFEQFNAQRKDGWRVVTDESRVWMTDRWHNEFHVQIQIIYKDGSRPYDELDDDDEVQALRALAPFIRTALESKAPLYADFKLTAVKFKSAGYLK